MKKKILIIVVLILILETLIVNTAFAAGNFSVTSSKSLTEGSTSSITITANGCGGKFQINSSDNDGILKKH